MFPVHELARQEYPQTAQRLLTEMKPIVEAIPDLLIDRVCMKEIPYLNKRRLLTEAINTSDPLFNLHRIPRQIIIHQDSTKLQVQAFASHF